MKFSKLFQAVAGGFFVLALSNMILGGTGIFWIGAAIFWAITALHARLGEK